MPADRQTDRQTRSSQYSAPVAARTTMRRGVRFLSRRPRGDDTSTSSIFRTPRQDAAGHCPCSQRWPRSASPPSFLSSATAVLSPAQLRAAAAAAAAAAAEATGCAICHLCRRASRRRRRRCGPPPILNKRPANSCHSLLGVVAQWYRFGLGDQEVASSIPGQDSAAYDDSGLVVHTMCVDAGGLRY